MGVLKLFVTSYGRTGKHAALLLAVITYLLLQPVLHEVEFSSHLAHALFCFILLAAVVSSGSRRLARHMTWALIVPAVIYTWIADAHSPAWVISLAFSLNIVLLMVATANIFGDIYHDKGLNIDSILGAITAYLLIGLTFALTYDWISLLNRDAIVGLHNEGSVDAHLSHSVYFSFVTLSTLGYGDITPVTPVARTVTWMEAVTGQLFLAVLIAGLVGKLVSRPSPRTMG